MISRWAVVSMVGSLGGCTTLNLGGAPGFMGHRESGLAFHMGSQIGATMNGESGVAGEAFVEPRWVSRRGGVGLRTGYFFRTHAGMDKSRDLAGGVFTPTVGATVGPGIALHGGLGLMFQGGSGYRAMIGTTLWPLRKSGFGYGLHIELDFMRGTETDAATSYGQTSLTFGLELGL